MNFKIEIEYENETVVIEDTKLNLNIVHNNNFRINIINDCNNNIDFRLKKYYRNQKVNNVNIYINDDKILTFNENVNKTELEINLNNKNLIERLIIYS